MTGISGLAWALAAFVQAAPAAPPAIASGQDYLANVAARLDLTAKGARKWLAALGVTRKAPAVEVLLIVSRSGQIVGSQTGADGNGVTFSDETERTLLAAGADLVLVHNHPHNTALGINDLTQLSKPGVVAIAAIGHDGSLYIAVRGPRYDMDRFVETQYGPARREILARMRHAITWRDIRPEAATGHLPHVTALALAKAKVIEYRAVLSRERHESFNAVSVPFAPIAAAGAAVLFGPRRHER
jgi:hypothetical protein